MSTQHIAIIGGGFSGIVTAIHLIDATTVPLRISVVEEREQTGRGIAYSTGLPDHLINGPAKSFSLYPKQPASLAAWLRDARDRHGWTPPPGVDFPDSFPPRRIYGDYVQAQLSRALRQAGARVEFSHFQERAVDLIAVAGAGAVSGADAGAGRAGKGGDADEAEKAAGYQVVLANGQRLDAQRVVLATGLFRAGDSGAYRVSRRLRQSPRLVGDIWQPRSWKNIGQGESLLVIGASLTALDAMISADSHGFEGNFTVLSRHGLLAQRRRDVEPWPNLFAGGVPATLRELRRLTVPVRRQLKKENGDWQRLAGAIRAQLLPMWDNAAPGERERFLHRLRRFWEISIHRAAPESATKLEQLIAGGRLTRWAGQIDELNLDDDGRVRLTWRPRGGANAQTAVFDHVVDAHGYEFDWRRTRDKLIENLLARELVQVHATGFGIDAQRKTGALRNADGGYSDSLFAVGHPLRGVTWESTAISELSLGAENVALALAAIVESASGAQPVQASETLAALSTATGSGAFPAPVSRPSGSHAPTAPAAAPEVAQSLLLCASIAAASPSAQARQAGRTGVLDFLAVSLPVVWRRVPDAGFDAVARLYGNADAASLAVRLGYQAHALDYDDYHPGMRGHPSTVILPALLALAASPPSSTTGKAASAVGVDEFLDAYTVGVELSGRIALATGARHYVDGFHATATIGAIAAAGAAARLLGLDAAGIDNALGLAATQAAGLRAQFGSAAKPLHAGQAARVAVESALLAQAGFLGRPGVLDAFIGIMGGADARPALLAEPWGASWRIVAPGLQYKRYPTCGGTHQSADAALALRLRLTDEFAIPAARIAASIAGIVVRFPEGADIAPSVRRPADGVQARFSLEYVIAAGLIEGGLSLERFAEGPVLPAIAALADRVRREVDPAAPADAGNPDGRFHHVIVTLVDGRTLEQRVTRDDVLAIAADVPAKLKASLALGTATQAENVRRHAALREDADLRALVLALDAPTARFQAPATRHAGPAGSRETDSAGLDVAAREAVA